MRKKMIVPTLKWQVRMSDTMALTTVEGDKLDIDRNNGVLRILKADQIVAAFHAAQWASVVRVVTDGGAK